MKVTPESESTRRVVRSFVRREGRMTSAQERALRDLWPQYGVELSEGAIDLSAIFARTAPVVMEIGFGNGEALADIATNHPHINYLGVEVHRPGVGHLLRGLLARHLSNVRVICTDANEVLARLPDESLAEVRLFFPDPWPKKRHHKRRLVQPVFVETVRRKLGKDGLFRLATDWEDYAQHMLAVLTTTQGLENVSFDGGFEPRSEARSLTKFERRGQRLGHVVRDLVFRRVG